MATVAALAENIGHILVLDPWLLTHTLLSELIERLQATGAVLWLVRRVHSATTAARSSTDGPRR